MGQKVNPIGFRLGIYKTWDSRWFAGKGYSDFVLEDYKIRKYLKKRLIQAGISKIEIERAADKIRIKIHTARPGLVIGKKGAEIENVKRDLEKQIKREAIIDIQEVRKPEVDAQLIAENVCLRQQLVVLKRRQKRPSLYDSDRRFWVLASRWFLRFFRRTYVSHKIYADTARQLRLPC